MSKKTTQLPAVETTEGGEATLTSSVASDTLQSEVVTVTPLALSSEQMKQSNPDAVKVIEGDAVKANNARISAICAEFGDDKELMAKAISDPAMTVQAIKAERYEALKSEISTLKAENSKLKTEGVVGFAASDKQAGKLTDDATALDREAEKLWASDKNLREEFGGVYTTFRADFIHKPDEYRK